MKKSVFKSRAVTKGFSFGLTSGIITTLGMIVGLESATRSNLVVIAGILSIAIADSFSDSLGAHISEEAEAGHSTREIWITTVYTFITKFIFALFFLIPFLLMQVQNATALSIVIGLGVICVYSWIIAKKQGKNPFEATSEHFLISIIVILATHFAGEAIHYFIS